MGFGFVLEDCLLRNFRQTPNSSLMSNNMAP